MGQFESPSQSELFRFHLSPVMLMIISGQMEQSMENEYLQFCLARVTEVCCILLRDFCRDGYITRNLWHLGRE